MKYTFVLSGWEGSAADSRVLRDAVTRPNGLRVPTGNYYLCDCGYTNGPGFLAPYRGVRYHLDEWSSGRAAPQNHRELFNLRHAKAQDDIPEDIGDGHNTNDGPDFVDQVETSQIWTTWRDTFAISMYNEWRGNT
ncbi:hypothetical protein DH2020_007953 [Rehmannia glutinosa]|uniref:DDE Tnp4 domain-containing protein n=1 Tax=Rehmannia glutinosa TaxID=99300 RepID=A0ABR0TZM5_REHGL